MAYDVTRPIMLVDDYVTMLRILRNMFIQLNFTNIHEATDGVSALQELRSGVSGQIVCCPRVVHDHVPQRVDHQNPLRHLS